MQCGQKSYKVIKSFVTFIRASASVYTILELKEQLLMYFVRQNPVYQDNLTEVQHYYKIVVFMCC